MHFPMLLVATSWVGGGLCATLPIRNSNNPPRDLLHADKFNISIEARDVDIASRKKKENNFCARFTHLATVIQYMAWIEIPYVDFPIKDQCFSYNEGYEDDHEYAITFGKFCDHCTFFREEGCIGDTSSKAFLHYGSVYCGYTGTNRKGRDVGAIDVQNITTQALNNASTNTYSNGKRGEIHTNIEARKNNTTPHLIIADEDNVSIETRDVETAA